MVKRMTGESGGAQRESGSYVSRRRALASFRKPTNLGEHAKPEIDGWMFVQPSVVVIPITDHPCFHRLKVRLIVSNETTVKRRIKHRQMHFNGFENLDDILPRQLNHERNNPRFTHGENPFQMTLAHMTIVVRVRRHEYKMLWVSVRWAKTPS